MESTRIAWPLEDCRGAGPCHRQSDGVGQVLDVFVAKPFQLLECERAAGVRFVAENPEVIQPPIKRPHQAAIAVGVADGNRQVVGKSAALVERARFQQSDAVGAGGFIETHVVTGRRAIICDSEEDPNTDIGVADPGAGGADIIDFEIKISACAEKKEAGAAELFADQSRQIIDRYPFRAKPALKSERQKTIDRVAIRGKSGTTAASSIAHATGN